MSLLPGAVPNLDRATAELVYSLSIEAEDWAPKRYGFRVGTRGFLVGEHTRSEVVRAPAVAALPHVPVWLLGVMNLRGNLIPVADLRALCGEAHESRRPAYVLVLTTGETAIGIPVDDLPTALAELQALPETPPVPESLSGHTHGAFAGEGRVWLAFDHDAFFRTLAQDAGIHS